VHQRNFRINKRVTNNDQRTRLRQGFGGQAINKKMNKILNINLGGYALTIDDDAYEYLQAYLESIRRRFKESEGRDEIVGDIETRLGEIISQGMGNRTIVMLPDVEDAASVMGKPEDFGSDDPAESKKTGHSRSSGSSVPPIRTGKRLFRDEEDSVVAGVCSGLSAYFGIQDPVWMRLIFVLMVFLSFGFWVPAYLLLWILVQPAKSAADRLAMRGEPVNVDNIAREIEEGFERLSAKVNEFGADTSKKGASGAQNVMNTGVTAIGRVFGFMIRLIAKFATLIALLIAIGLFIGFGGAWIASILALITAAPFVDYFSPLSGSATWLGFANLFFLLGIPVIAFALFFIRILFKTSVPNWLHGSIWLFWTVNFISAIILISIASKEFRQSSSVNKPIDLSNINSDTMRVVGINVNGAYDNHYWDFNQDDIRLNNFDLEMNDQVDIKVRRSASNQFECFQTITARGSTREDAMDNAVQTGFEINTEGNKLRVPMGFSIQKGKKWKGQTVKIIIGVPEGKFITFDDVIYHRAGSDMEEYAKDNNGDYISRRPNKVFKMTNDGIVCADCPQLGDREYRGERNYENFILEGDFKTEILEGESFRVRLEGSDDLKALVKTIKTGDKITFTTNGRVTNGAVRVIIETPTFTSLHADNTGEITIRGFDEGNASISAKGSSRIKAYLDASNNLDVTLSGKCALEITGKGGELLANLTDGATLEASNWRANDAEISASDASKARIYVKNNALVLSDAASNVRVDGGATIQYKRE
jgi:phage shock protein PspC (stress-responsive transcriptional regulator)